MQHGHAKRQIPVPIMNSEDRDLAMWPLLHRVVSRGKQQAQEDVYRQHAHGKQANVTGEIDRGHF